VLLKSIPQSAFATRVNTPLGAGLEAARSWPAIVWSVAGNSGIFALSPPLPLGQPLSKALPMSAETHVNAKETRGPRPTR
jgi:hypothetical protein